MPLAPTPRPAFTIRLEGPEARALYESAGYRLCGPFAEYRDDPLSVFMEKIFDAGAAT